MAVNASQAATGRTWPRAGWPASAGVEAPAAVILAAGKGSRLRQGSDAPPKPLTPLLGSTLVERAVRSCRSAGVTDFVVVVGFRSDLIAPYLHTLGLELSVRLRVVENHRWELGNGTSALAAEPYVNGAFFVLMADHIFAPEFLERLVERDDGRRACALVVDRDLEEVRDVPEATKVRLSSGRVSAIGKQLTRFDAVDTGVFLCRSALFDALREASASGEHTFGGAVELLARRGEVSWAPAGGLFWQDIDTPKDLDFARSRLLAERATSPSLLSR